MAPYSIVNIPLDAREDTEQLGSKPKFWVLLDGQRWLFKEARQNTGEDWSEKVAAEIARVLGIEAATVELAAYDGRRGCISLNFVDVEAGEALVHGNEILAWRVTGYDQRKKFRQSDHTIANIQRAIRATISHTEKADAILTGLAGYMVFDALIGNTDRHHENWGLKLHSNHELSAAPSFDHASALGRELLDERRQSLINTHKVDWYMSRGCGGVFGDPEQPHGENPIRLVQSAAKAYPAYFTPALQQVVALEPDRIKEVFDALPVERVSDLAKQFGLTMILSARKSLIEILK